MKDYQERVVDEFAQLMIKLVSLRKFLAGERFNTLSTVEQRLLLRQEKHMTKYAHTLSDRIYWFKGEEE